MSGPVWRLIQNEAQNCSECGRNVSIFRAAGKVVDGDFQITHRYCEECYKALDKFLDEVA